MREIELITLVDEKGNLIKIEVPDDFDVEGLMETAFASGDRLRRVLTPMDEELLKDVVEQAVAADKLLKAAENLSKSLTDEQRGWLCDLLKEPDDYDLRGSICWVAYYNGEENVDDSLEFPN